eukprot:2364314-Rhodomonas_salina.1
MLARDRLGRIFSGDDEVVRTVAIIVPIVCLFQVYARPWNAPMQAFDCTQSLVAGCFRGMGKQGVVTGLNLAGYAAMHAMLLLCVWEIGCW